MLDDPKRLYISYWDYPLSYRKNTVFIPFNQWYYYSPHAASLFGYVKYSGQGENQKAVALPITYSKPRKGYYWTPAYRNPCGAVSENAAYVFFPNEPVLYKYSLKNHKIISKHFDFITIDKIKPYKIGDEGHNFDACKARYESLAYDSVNQRLYMVARVGCDTSDGPLAIQRENAIYSFIVMDMNMNKIGEGIIPEGYVPNIQPYKDGFLLYKKDAGKSTYTYFTYDIKKGDASCLLNQIHDRRDKFNSISPKRTKIEALTAYLKKIVGKDDSKYSTYVMFSESACPHCSTRYSQVLLKNKQNILNNDIAIVMINGDTTVIQDFCSEIDGFQATSVDLPPLNKIPVYCDTHNAFYHFFDPWVNIRVVRFNNKGELISDEIINPSDMDKFNMILQGKSAKSSE